MNTTPNINLSTYTSDPNDKFNLLVTFNDNMSKIDTAIGAQNDAIDVIEQIAGTAVTTANTASATATEALQTAEGKTSINDNVASATTTYSSNKINELIPEIDDTTTSTTKTWSSSKINTEISALTQKDVEYIQNPDTNKYDYFTCWCAKKGNVIYISGEFRYNQAPSSQYDEVLTLPSNIDFHDGGSGYPNIANGYITKSGSPTYLKNEVIFQAVNGKIRMLLTDGFNYSQIDDTYTFHFSFTLMSDN